MRKRNLPALFFASAIFCASADATTLKRMAVSELARAAMSVVRARCLDNSFAWQEGEIWTLTHFEVLERWKNNAPTGVTVRLLGGHWGHLVSHVPGVPQFRPGEEVILFLESRRAGEYSITAWAEGTFRIRRDATTGEESAMQETAVWETFNPATRQFSSAGLREAPLARLRELVRSAGDLPGRTP